MKPSGRSLPPETRRALRLYNLLFPFVFTALLPGFLRRMVRRGGFREKFRQRFGSYSARERERFAAGKWIWIHSISVGETRIALKLAQALRQRDPTAQIALSITTSTGYTMARAGAPEWMEVVYNPIDAPNVVRRVLNAIRPAQLIFVEGEIWPNLVAAAWSRGIPIALVDARLSPRSEARIRRFRRWTASIFNLIDTFTISDRTDADRWEKIGVDRAKIHYTGSIKFDESPGSESSASEALRRLVARIGIDAGTPVLLAGSTWEPEEIVLAEMTRRLRADHPDLVLVLVPRHVERCPEIARTLTAAGFRVQRRSELSARPAGSREMERTDVLLVDVTGELRDWYSLATVVFVGKSLEMIGGQNPAEPAFSERAMVFGPHMENFASVVQLLLQNDAALQVADAARLEETVHALLADPGRRDRLGKRAREALELHHGAADRVATRLAINHSNSV